MASSACFSRDKTKYWAKPASDDLHARPKLDPISAFPVCARRSQFVRAYEALRDEERALRLAAAAAACVAFSTVAAVGISLGIVFPDEPADRPFCRERRMLEALPAAASSREEEPEAYRSRGGAFYMTTAEAADFYWMVVLVPSAVLFATSAAYLVSGESVLVLFVVMLRFLLLQC